MLLTRLAIVLCLFLFLLPACTGTHQAADDLVTWTPPRGDLGRLVVLREVVEVGDEAKRGERTEAIREVVASAFAALPSTELVDDAVLIDALAEDRSWRSFSDYETVTAARAAGLDTVGTLVVDDCAGMLSIGFVPLPGWDVASEVNYRLRLIDVESGRVIVDTRRRRRVGTYLGLALPEPLEENFATDLAGAMAEG